MILTDIFLAVPIGIIYNILSYQLSDLINNNLTYDEKIQRNLMFNFFSGVFAIFLGYYAFKKNRKLRNRGIRFGLYFGAFILIFNSLVYNWSSMSNLIKIIIFVLLLSLLIFLAYKFQN